MAGQYGYDPSTTVTLNHKDYIRYMYKYPEWGNDMVILFWVDFLQQQRFGVSVQELHGVWSLRLSLLDQWVRQQKLKSHSYQERIEDSGTNAKSSWLIDIKQCKEHKLKG